MDSLDILGCPDDKISSECLHSSKQYETERMTRALTLLLLIYGIGGSSRFNEGSMDLLLTKFKILVAMVMRNFDESMRIIYFQGLKGAHVRRCQGLQIYSISFDI